MIVNRLPAIMNQKGISIRELSRVTDITYTTVRAVYHGGRRSVQLDVLDSICRALEIQPGDIYHYYENESAVHSTVITAPDPQVSKKFDRTSDSKENQNQAIGDPQDPDWRVWW